MKIITLTLLAAFSLLGTAVAQTMPMSHGNMPASSPSDQAFMDGMVKMHTDMDIKMSGNADKDFVGMMIPHHQGAIDMAKVELQYGKDPDLRKLAEDIIKAQVAEIAGMKAWLAKHAK